MVIYVSDNEKYVEPPCVPAISYSPISTLDGSKVRQVHDVARER